MGRDVLFVAFFASLLAALLSVFVEPLHRVGVPRVLAALAVMLGLVGALFGIGWLAYPSLQEQLPLIRREIPEAFEQLRIWLLTQ
jgi:predicted PurR-regulated permease PerM